MLPDKIIYKVNQLNSLDESIQFTFEMEEENKLIFLDVMIIRNTNCTINTTVYRKPTNTDIYINWHSHSPLQWKKTIGNMSFPQTDCNESYIGETERRSEERIIDHNKRDKKSHICKNSSENSHPKIWLDSFQINGRNYGNRIKRKIGEALLVNELKPSLNKQDKLFISFN